MTSATFPGEGAAARGGRGEEWRLLLPAFSHVHIKELVLRLWLKGVEMSGRVAGVVGAFRCSAGGGGRRGRGWAGAAAMVGDLAYSALSGLRL